MTARWGPLGWLTLHSISANYPENPTAEDKVIVKKYIGLFADTITCPSCKNHFLTLFHTYVSKYPSWADSRANVFYFICRAHNTVNVRLDKPRIQSVRDSIDTLLQLTKITSPAEYRKQYLIYLQRIWGRPDSEGFIMSGAVREMIKINNEYWNPRETGFVIDIPEADVLTTIVPTRAPSGIALPGLREDGTPVKVGFSLKSGRFSLIRR